MKLAELEDYFSVFACASAYLHFVLPFFTLQSLHVSPLALTHSSPVSTVSATGAATNKLPPISSSSSSTVVAARAMSTLVEDDGDDESPRPPSGEEAEEGKAAELQPRGQQRPQVRAH